jgi:epoxyqueuosine reductase
MNNLSKSIKQRALELGFTKVGIAMAEPLHEEGNHLREWLKHGYQGTMDWVGRNADKRIDPSLVLPGVKSVVAVAMNYYVDVPHSSGKQIGKVSRYAWGDDYHEILQARLKELLNFILEREPNANGKVYVDTGPVMEKAWAQRAGIGWLGKHTNIISQEDGSWLFLGEILLDIELEYDSPATDHCGTCTLCIEACPTDAITEPYVVDSNKCISYLTIEHRGEIAKELAEKFDNWIYGCDICQDVCPWNEKYSRETTVVGFQPRGDAASPDLRRWAKMSETEFSKKFTKSAIKRTKHKGLMRNLWISITR